MEYSKSSEETDPILSEIIQNVELEQLFGIDFDNNLEAILKGLLGTPDFSEMPDISKLKK